MKFTTTAHDRCIYRTVIKGKLVLLLRQVDDFLIACEDEQTARDITTEIGERIQFKSEKEQNDLPIEFLGLVEDYNGVDIVQTSRKIKLSAKSYIQRFLRSHMWDTESDGVKEDTEFKDCMKSSKPISPLPSDCVDQLFKQVGPKEESPEFLALHKRCCFAYRTVLGKCMYAYVIV